MIKYGIKLRGKLDNNGFFTEGGLRSIISEHTGPANERVLEFDSISDAEIYAQNHELRNYNIEAIHKSL